MIYPHVVGGSVGLPSIWVLFAVTIGANLMGIAGMVIFIPLCSVLYTLIRESVNKRLIVRKIPSNKWAQDEDTQDSKSESVEAEMATTTDTTISTKLSTKVDTSIEK